MIDRENKLIIKESNLIRRYLNGDEQAALILGDIGGFEIRDCFFPAAQINTWTDFNGQYITIGDGCGVKNRDFAGNVTIKPGAKIYELGKHVAPDAERTEEEIEREKAFADIDDIVDKLVGYASHPDPEVREKVAKKLKDKTTPDMASGAFSADGDEVEVVDKSGKWVK